MFYVGEIDINLYFWYKRRAIFGGSVTIRQDGLGAKAVVRAKKLRFLTRSGRVLTRSDQVLGGFCMGFVWVLTRNILRFSEMRRFYLAYFNISKKAPGTRQQAKVRKKKIFWQRIFTTKTPKHEEEEFWPRMNTNIHE